MYKREVVNKINKHCEKCDVRIPASHPRLHCAFCLKLKHAKCQKLSKAEAINIVKDPTLDWICYDCISNILPVNACKQIKSGSKNDSIPKFKQKCGACSGHSYKPSNVSTCYWCDAPCHTKCIKGQLGCLACCAVMYPGYAYHNWELNGDPNLGNYRIFNPYNPNNLTNDIGDRIENEIEHNCMWQEVSDFLTDCKYKQFKDTTKSKNGELKTFNLNIRSLAKHIGALKEEIEILKKYDVLCFNETICDTSKLPNGKDDLLLDEFHPPTVRPPTRLSDKGGGLAIYVSKSVCNEDDIEKLKLEVQPPDPSGEFLCVKLTNCKKTEKTVILGNVYRSPSNNSQKFLDLYEQILQKLNKYKSKHTIILGILTLT